jgi:lipoprotein-anchoring transpeptidase ErfK/SrfK
VRHRSFIAVAAVLVVLFGGAAALVVIDASAKDQIAEGVSVAGVPLGGLSEEAARAKLQREVAAKFDETVVVHHANKTWTLSATRAQVRADVDAMVDAALERSREGSIFARVAREITGDDLDADLPAEVSYEPRAVQKLVTRVENSVNRKPRDASIDFEKGLEPIEGRPGLAVRAQQLEDQIHNAMERPGVDRTFVAQTRKIAPKVTTNELADKYPKLIVVERGAFRLRLYERLKLVKTYGIAVGQVGLETPAGLYEIQNKAINPAWSVPNSAWAGSLAGQVIPGGVPENPLKARWLGIYDGAGIHGTDAVGSIGTAASHGCIRMLIPDVIELYDRVDVGTPVYVS